MDKNILNQKLFKAIEKNGERQIDYLIDDGADINAVNKDGETVIIHAFRHNLKWIRKFMLLGAVMPDNIRCFYFDDNFCLILVHGKSFITRNGVLSSEDKSISDAFAFDAEKICINEADKIINSKINEGYRELNHELAKNILITPLEILIKIEKAKIDKIEELSINLFHSDDLFRQICMISSLKRLEVKNIINIPPEIINLTKLVKLEMDGKYKDLPKELFLLYNLEDLKINSAITSLPEELGSLTKLKNLVLVNTQIVSLPHSIGNLLSLENLEFTYIEKLKSIPEEIGKLTHLKKLQIFNSSIASLPDTIGELSRLEKLLLGYNKKLKLLTKKTGLLKNLAQLDISNTAITTLPVEIADLSKLQKLDLNGSPVKNIPKELITGNAGIKKIFNHLRK
jgi:hypothetical protein